MNLSAESVASVRLGLMYDQSGEAVAVVALKSKCVTGGGPCGLGGGLEPLRCVSAHGVTGARVRPERRNCG